MWLLSVHNKNLTYCKIFVVMGIFVIFTVLNNPEKIANKISIILSKVREKCKREVLWENLAINDINVPRLSLPPDSLIFCDGQ